VIPGAATTVDWSSGAWLNPPPDVRVEGQDLIVHAAAGSDFWRTTAYGYVHDDGHALLHPFAVGTAVEVSLRADFDSQFDQAGILVRADAERWVKAGVELADGVLQLGAVVTHGMSDWSSGPVPSWAGGIVTIRVSRSDDALTVRARSETTDWGLVRVAPWAGGFRASAGPFCCAPTRAGLEVRFISWRVGAADDRLHE
jgi:regulation of enolase protein 1 (concanavalin A-like superfamily)